MDTSVTVDSSDSALPEWLTSHMMEVSHVVKNALDYDPDPKYPRTKDERDLRNHNLTCLFERILDGMCEGNSARVIITLDHNGFSVGEVMRWIYTNPERRKRYDEADAIRAIVRVDIIREIVDDETVDPTYKTERTDFTKWEASKVNRDKYGDKQQVDVNNTTINVDIRALIDKRVNGEPPRLPVVIEHDEIP
jgi:hypothetical protein